MKKSFTIVEFLIYIGILSIILLVFLDLLVSLTRFRTEAESTSNVQQDSSFLLNKFMADVHRAKMINLPLHPPDESNVLNLDIDGTVYSYSTDSAQNLNMTDGTNTYQLNGYDTSVPGIKFTRLGQDDIHDVVKITFTVTSRVKNPAGYESQSYETVVGLREKP